MTTQFEGWIRIGWTTESVHGDVERLYKKNEGMMENINCDRKGVSDRQSGNGYSTQLALFSIVLLHFSLYLTWIKNWLVSLLLILAKFKHLLDYNSQLAGLKNTHDSRDSNSLVTSSHICIIIHNNHIIYCKIVLPGLCSVWEEVIRCSVSIQIFMLSWLSTYGPIGQASANLP